MNKRLFIPGPRVPSTQPGSRAATPNGPLGSGTEAPRWISGRDRSVRCRIDGRTKVARVRIFHIAEAPHWEAAQSSGSYLQSTLGLTLADEGFIHCSREDQWPTVLETYYAGHMGELVLLEIDTTRLASPWQEDPVGDTTFPHVYGPIGVDAVVAERRVR